MKPETAPDDPEAVARARALLDGIPIEDLRAIAECKIAHLEVALHNARTIGVAMGIIVERHKVSECEAFQMLVNASQRGNRKLRDIAADISTPASYPANRATQSWLHRARGKR